MNDRKRFPLFVEVWLAGLFGILTILPWIPYFLLQIISHPGVYFSGISWWNIWILISPLFLYISIFFTLLSVYNFLVIIDMGERFPSVHRNIRYLACIPFFLGLAIFGYIYTSPQLSPVNAFGFFDALPYKFVLQIFLLAFTPYYGLISATAKNIYRDGRDIKNII